jgi:hypothetical protein
LTTHFINKFRIIFYFHYNIIYYIICLYGYKKKNTGLRVAVETHTQKVTYICVAVVMSFPHRRIGWIVLDYSLRARERRPMPDGGVVIGLPRGEGEVVGVWRVANSMDSSFILLKKGRWAPLACLAVTCLVAVSLHSTDA